MKRIIMACAALIALFALCASSAEGGIFSHRFADAGEAAGFPRPEPIHTQEVAHVHLKKGRAFVV